MKISLFAPFVYCGGKFNFITLALASLCCATLNLKAQDASEFNLYNNINIFLGQGNSQVNGSQALLNNSCVPTSTANGLSFLEQYA